MACGIGTRNAGQLGMADRQILLSPGVGRIGLVGQGFPHGAGGVAQRIRPFAGCGTEPSRALATATEAESGSIGGSGGKDPGGEIFQFD